MQRLFAFIFKYRVTFVFAGVEIFCLYLIYSRNDYQKTTFVNSTNAVAGQLLTSRTNVFDYFDLDAQNNRLARENAELKSLIVRNNALSKFSSHKPGSEEVDKYRVYSGKIVRNSTHMQNNYITINIGKKHGIEPGMGVITDEGIVGSVVRCSNRYSLVASVLHSQSMISAKIKKSGTLGTIHWTGKDQKLFELQYIPRHVKLNKGDTIVTSGYNAVFPEDILIGTIKDFELQDNRSFYDINVELIPNLSNLNYIYVIENIHKKEQQMLEEELQ